jgi:hypothetical protein
MNNGHLFTRPGIPPEFLVNFEALTDRLDHRAATNPRLDRLASKRKYCRGYGVREDLDEAFAQLWRLRSELVVADKLLDIGVDLTIGCATPDLECLFAGREFGVEVTTRLPTSIERALRSRLAEVAPSGAGCIVYLRRRQSPKFTMSPESMRDAVDQVVAAVVEKREHLVFLPQAGLVAEIMPGEVATTEARVLCIDDMPGDSQEYWRAAALQIIPSVTDKACKTYSMDSVLALDISRLGWCGKWPIDTVWTAAFDDVLDNKCTRGPLKGIVVFRSWLWDRANPELNTLQVVTVRGGDLAMLVATLLSSSSSRAHHFAEGVKYGILPTQ